MLKFAFFNINYNITFITINKLWSRHGLDGLYNLIRVLLLTGIERVFQNTTDKICFIPRVFYQGHKVGGLILRELITGKYFQVGLIYKFFSLSIII